MSQKTSKEGLFSDDWLEVQRKYWDSWTDMSRKAMGMEGGDATKPWESALDHWWKALSPATPDAAKDFMERMMDQGKVFFRMAETFIPGSGQGSDGWSALTKTLEDLQGRFMGNLDDSGDALHRMMAFWELPYDNWQRMMSSMSPIPGDLLRNMPHDPVRGHVDRVLSAPGLGYTREEQTQYQDLMRRTLDYQRALQDYLGFYSKLGVKSVERMRSYLQGVIDSGKSIDSARAIYDNWVRCCEEVYADEVITPEYAKIHGHLINAQMALKRRMSVMVDESLGALNMPTRSELRTLQDRLQEARRENKRLRHDLSALQRQVAALAAAGGAVEATRATAPRAQVAARPAPAATSAPAPRPATSKPTTAKKTVARKKAAVKPAND
ncbi:MAG: class III poly(R)-hydroxyalkanoic acid synthase subunit PhaE [Bdellovibrio bacteriovorus]